MTQEHRCESAGRQSALVMVDIQPDFLPGGALPVSTAEDFLPRVRMLMECGRFGLQIATQDWHPPGHVSFASSHPNRRPFDIIDLYGHEQTLWPEHCVQDSPGAELHPGLPWKRVAAVVRKGTDPAVDSYSGFRNNFDPQGRRPPTGLAGYLRERGVTELYLCGLARDICVKWTAVDAADAGFRTYVVWDATRPVDAATDDRTRRELESKGIQLMTAEAVAAAA